MNILLDTHALLWAIGAPKELSKKASEEIINPDNMVFVSSISVLELVIKQSIGKLTIPENIEREIAIHNFTPLPVTIKHSLAVKKLPLLHKDPFDRLLIAQAMEENLTLVTDDWLIKQYDVKILKASV